MIDPNAFPPMSPQEWADRLIVEGPPGVAIPAYTGDWRDFADDLLETNPEREIPRRQEFPWFPAWSEEFVRRFD